MLKLPFTMLKLQRTLDSKGDKGTGAGTLEQEEIIRFLGRLLNKWAAPKGKANCPSWDANKPESIPPIACSPTPMIPTNLPPPAPEPPIDYQLLRDLEYHADQLVEQMGETMQAVDNILRATRDLEIAELTIPQNNKILAFAASYPPHVIQAYQEAWQLTQEYNSSFGFGLSTGLGATTLGPSDGSMEDHQLQVFNNSSKQASITAPNTPSTIQGDLLQGSHHCLHSGLSIPIPIEQLAIGDSKMLDAKPIGTQTPTNPGLQPTPKLVPNQSGSVETTSKEKQLGGTETQDPGACREGEGEAFRKDKEGTRHRGEGVKQGPQVMEVTDKFTTQVNKET
ncbi:hypothetical protein RhiXN_11290 [Rhizoctonia solani]|uniref:Uncharacterized protein n=2 Tax=Rhizoctonia solani TaxID=456999 RepID=A0A8H8P4A0_9AGAM|nr:uncharacterized protein RhiXN_11290 [Rhizoctonia solani]QRW24378.1 hypothetical protein RhiXN_11290 [Rhizoctonia solani]